MKKTLIKSGMVVAVIYTLLLGTPTKASAHVDFLVTVTRMVTTGVPSVLRGGLYLVEGAVDGMIDGLFDRKGFLHGESRYI